jgi:2-oxoglutarate ferredoxin oxidoreductase subunit gamma
MALTQIRVGGFGGQGVIMAGMIVGRAASLYDGKEASLSQSFGPEARGSACSAQVIVSDSTIHYPYLTSADILVAMSQEAFEKFSFNLDPNGLVLIEEDLVKAHDLPPGVTVHAVPSTRLAEEIGRRLVANIVMVGFFTAVSGLITDGAARRAVKDLVPRGTEDLNLMAFDRGYEYGQRSKAGAQAQHADAGGPSRG